MSTIDSKIEELRKLTDNFLFIEYYSHTECDMFKIPNEYARYPNIILVLSPVSEGIEKALDIAIEMLKKEKSKWEITSMNIFKKYKKHGD